MKICNQPHKIPLITVIKWICLIFKNLYNQFICTFAFYLRNKVEICRAVLLLLKQKIFISWAVLVLFSKYLTSKCIVLLNTVSLGFENILSFVLYWNILYWVLMNRTPREYGCRNIHNNRGRKVRETIYINTGISLQLQSYTSQSISR